jgi:hypothetical protein
MDALLRASSICPRISFWCSLAMFLRIAVCRTFCLSIPTEMKKKSQKLDLLDHLYKETICIEDF